EADDLAGLHALQGEHPVTALLVVVPGDDQPPAALVFAQWAAVAHPAHRVRVAVDREKGGKVRVTPPTSAQPLGNEHPVAGACAAHGHECAMASPRRADLPPRR